MDTDDIEAVVKLDRSLHTRTEDPQDVIQFNGGMRRPELGFNVEVILNIIIRSFPLQVYIRFG